MAKLKKTLILLVLFPLFLTGQMDPETTDSLKTFKQNGKAYTVECVPVQHELHLILRDPQVHHISRQFRGENTGARITQYQNHFMITWINHHLGVPTLCFYHSLEGRSTQLRLPGFKSLSYPRMILRNQLLDAIYFIGNRSDNDELYYYSLTDEILVNITQTPFCEKDFDLNPQNPEYIKTHSLFGDYLIRFDPDSRRVLNKQKISSPENSGKKTIETQARRQSEEISLHRTILAFGDSITAGKMRMTNLVGDYHTDLAYPYKLQETLRKDYGEIVVHALGVPAEGTLGGAQRIDSELAQYTARYFLLLEGTNDTWPNTFSLDSSMENVAYIIDAVLAKKMQLVISTIPPRNDKFGERQYVKDNINAFNEGIIKLAGEKGIACIDTHSAFMNYYPPSGWTALLEDRENTGNHPSPAGHEVMTDLFIDALLSFTPETPGGVIKNGQSYYWYEIIWNRGYEFDLDGYRIHYGYSPDQLNHVVLTADPLYRFLFLTFNYSLYSRIYFTITALDSKGNESGPTPVLHTD